MVKTIPLTVVCTLNGARTDGVLVAVMVEDLEALEARAEAAEARIAELTAENGRLRQALAKEAHNAVEQRDAWAARGAVGQEMFHAGRMAAIGRIVKILDDPQYAAIAPAAEQQNTTGNSSAASSLAAALLKETLANGGEINVPSLGLVIGPGGVRSAPAAEQQEGGEGE